MATILVVDDRATNREFLTSLLGYRGHRLLEAGDGVEALTILGETPVDLVITDILMPTMDGYELVRRMRESAQTASVPVMFFTAHYNEREARGLADACGVSRVLTKPAEPELILQAVDQVLANEAPPAPPPLIHFDEQHLRVVSDKLIERTEELRRQASHMAALLDMSLQLASERDPKKLLAGFARASRDLVAARYVVVAVHAAGSKAFGQVIVRGMDEQTTTRLEGAFRRDGAFAGLGGDPRAFRYRSDDDDPRKAGLPAEHPPITSLVKAQIRSLAHAYGWVCASGKLGLAEFSEEDERLLDIFAALVGRIYENGSLNADMERQAEELRRQVAERKEAERETERIFQTSQDVLLVTDGYGKLLRASPSVATVFGHRPEDMIGRSAGDFVLADDLEATRAEMRAARAGRTMRNFRSRYVHKDGRVVSLMWMGVWSEPDHRHFFIGRDMTEYDRTEEQLRQAQKMEAVGQLTGGIARDFNNILTVILANADSLQEDDGLDAAVKARLDEITEAVEHAADLTSQLLAFSRKQPLRPQPTDINELVVGTGKLLRRTLGEHVEIESLLGGNASMVSVDRAQLETALVNLSINARDAMPGGGKLLIETRNVTLDEDDIAAHADLAAGDYVMLAVTDTGSGMSPETLARVFEPFFTTKEVGKGTGLGLSMVYGFIKQSRGHITVYSEVGRGTTFKLYLPATVETEQAPRERKDDVVVGGKERILVVEDDPRVRQSVVLNLTSLGYQVTEAADGDLGLAAIEAAGRPFDLLLTDVIMPGELSGKTLADEVTRRSPATRVVFISGYTEDAIMRHGRLEAGVRLLSKPFRKADLARIIRQALDGTPQS